MSEKVALWVGLPDKGTGIDAGRRTGTGKCRGTCTGTDTDTVPSMERHRVWHAARKVPAARKRTYPTFASVAAAFAALPPTLPMSATLEAEATR
jgi:hypothetical protein